MTKETFHMVSCKAHPEHMQTWSMPHSAIFSECTACRDIDHKQIFTGFGHTPYNEHYNLYQVVIKKNRGESWEDFFERGYNTIRNNREVCLVTEFTDPAMEEKRAKIKSKGV